jgi:hypothetical protein
MHTTPLNIHTGQPLDRAAVAADLAAAEYTRRNYLQSAELAEMAFPPRYAEAEQSRHLAKLLGDLIASVQSELAVAS